MIKVILLVVMLMSSFVSTHAMAQSLLPEGKDFNELNFEGEEEIEYERGTCSYFFVVATVICTQTITFNVYMECMQGAFDWATRCSRDPDAFFNQNQQFARGDFVDPIEAFMAMVEDLINSSDDNVDDGNVEDDGAQDGEALPFLERNVGF